MASARLSGFSTGYHAAKFLEEEDGAKIVAIIERDGGLFDDNGLNVESVKQWINENGGVRGYPMLSLLALLIPCSRLRYLDPGGYGGGHSWPQRGADQCETDY